MTLGVDVEFRNEDFDVGLKNLVMESSSFGEARAHSADIEELSEVVRAR